MSAPEKPAGMEAPPPDLTPAEQSLLRSFRAMDDRSQGVIGRFTESQAGRCPRPAPPSLRLVAMGAP
jgi:hypothetical protein